ncbi:MAG: hypothetical protein M1829_004563 [Trizodia sp. TS-e1964]|nr:MAG: hypothetical protein M1829_004563 [Trizodia sp. TS-e1964]
MANPNIDDELEEGEREEGEEAGEDEEEEEEDEDDSDSDIDIITERKDGTQPEPPAQPPKYNTIRNLPARTASSEVSPRLQQAKAPIQIKAIARSGAELPAVATSKLDINAKPTYDAVGKPITQVNIDEDLHDNDKAWRRPGSDVSDYFNYGFDEFTWALYCAKQENLRSEYDQSKIEQSQKKMLEEMNMMLGISGMPGLPSIPAQPAAGPSALSMPPMPGMGDIPVEFQQHMMQILAQGGDPTQMDPALFASMQTGGAGTNTGNNQGQGQGFGSGQQTFAGQGQNQQQMGYGYDQNMMGANDGPRNRGGGNFGGRGGRGGGRRNW